MSDTNLNQSQFQPNSKLIEWMRDIRRTIHQNPELCNEEHRTQRFVCEKLQELVLKAHPEPEGGAQARGRLRADAKTKIEFACKGRGGT